MFKKFVVIGIVFCSCSARQANIDINPAVANEVHTRIDTLQAKRKLLENELDKEWFNTAIHVSVNGSPYAGAFNIGDIFVDKNGTVEFEYKLFESSGPAIRVQADKECHIKKSTFKISGDDSPSSKTVQPHINKIVFDRKPEKGKSLSFYIDMESEVAFRHNREKEDLHLKMYGFVNNVAGK